MNFYFIYKKYKIWTSSAYPVPQKIGMEKKEFGMSHLEQHFLTKPSGNSWWYCYGSKPSIQCKRKSFWLVGFCFHHHPKAGQVLPPGLSHWRCWVWYPLSWLISFLSDLSSRENRNKYQSTYAKMELLKDLSDESGETITGKCWDLETDPFYLKWFGSMTCMCESVYLFNFWSI